ncbi:DUF4189 domain-containing protein [Variovorax dokdonensis]|uniref:DUF4189 domain-containing protein n=1 Tax=Variovorax dokdonensis TaxID=344883 RepID=A0ABT7N5A8_9BURK|nr:DUF4189 domain-containing protein [Variovorax dokdonensis]MDM0043139.1 DUF4189 domain-containing protein [Variovorax dokdonensis]
MKNNAITTIAARALFWSCTALGLPAVALADAPPAWGAIAGTQGGYGYAFSQPSRAAAERAAIDQCEGALAKSRATSARGSCVVRTAFDRSCGAMAVGNFGEWGIAIAPTEADARRDAVQQCNSHLPTEPCKVSVGFCSLR